MERRSLLPAGDIYQVKSDVYTGVKTQLEAKRRWIVERSQQIHQELDNLSPRTEAMASLSDLLKQQKVGQLKTASNDVWRDLWIKTNMRLHPMPDGVLQIEYGLPLPSHAIVTTSPRCSGSERARLQVTVSGLPDGLGISIH